MARCVHPDLHARHLEDLVDPLVPRLPVDAVERREDSAEVGVPVIGSTRSWFEWKYISPDGIVMICDTVWPPTK